MDLNPDALYKALLLDTKSCVSGVRRVAANLLQKNFLRKLEEESEIAETRSLLKFLEANHLCGTWTDRSNTSLDEVLVGEFKRSVDDFLHPHGDMLVDSLAQLADHGRVGPGSSLLASGEDFYSKMFSSTLSVTSAHLYAEYKRYTRRHDLWNCAEIMRSSKYETFTLVDGSRMSYVPKYRDVARVICIEPTLNMYFQLGLAAILTERLKGRFGIDLETQQSKNRALAWVGSWNGDYFTIDLESASDSVSIRMLEATFPSWFVDLLLQLRSPYVNTDIGRLELEMVSSMGNGFTFPLQTMIFSCVVDACARMSGIPLRNPVGADRGDWGVFGDDIIAPTSLWGRVNRLLWLLGFTINASKSFAEGPFRESCGGDYWNGRNVRSVYVKRYATKQERYSIINRLSRWSATNDIPLPRTLEMLLKSVPWNPVPWYEDDSSGIQVPESVLRKRYVDPNGSLLGFPYVASNRFIRIGDRCLKVPGKRAKRVYNAPGILLSLISGAVRNGKISIRPSRDEEVSYQRRPRVYPSWDTCVGRQFQGGPKLWLRWETTVHCYVN